MQSAVLGIDIGGSGIKGAPVDVVTGEPLADRHRIETPDPATPGRVVKAIAKLVQHFDWHGPMGCGFPGVIKNGVVHTAANLDKEWIGQDLPKTILDATGLSSSVINDADAAGLAEARIGAGRNCSGLVLVVTLGTGIGTSLISNGRLIPNSEFGHAASPHGDVWERYAAASVRDREDLNWSKWGERVNEFLTEMCKVLWPDLIILGGGASKKFDKYKGALTVDVEVVPAELRNMAGIVGAALHAWDAQSVEMEPLGP